MKESRGFILSPGTIKPGGKMNDLPKLYFTMEMYLFPIREDELGELTVKMRDFLRIVEVVRPSRFIANALRWF